MEPPSSTSLQTRCWKYTALATPPRTDREAFEPYEEFSPTLQASSAACVFMLSQRAVGEKGGGSLHSNLLHPDSSAVVPSQKKRGRASRVCFPMANTSTGSPKGDPWHCQFCSDILERGRRYSQHWEERQVLVRAIPHGSGDGREERTQCGTNGS